MPSHSASTRHRGLGRRRLLTAAVRTLPAAAILGGGLVTLGAPGDAAAVGAATFPGANGRITFVSHLTENGDVHEQIYSMNHDGSDQKRLTNNPGYDSDPSWSPEATRIAFRSSRDGGNDLWVMIVPAIRW